MISNRRSILGMVLCWVAYGPAAPAQTTAQSLVVDPEGSTFSAGVEVALVTVGSMIGNFDIERNPTGTRTKPGLFGSFGATENVPVPAGFIPNLSGDPAAVPTGTLTLVTDPGSGTAEVLDLHVELVGTDPAVVGAGITLSFDTFRTQAPTALFIGATLPLPLGSAQLDVLTLAQSGTAHGNLDPDPAGYLLTITVPVTLTGSGAVFGTAFDIPPLPVPLLLSGIVDLDAEQTLIAAEAPLTVDGTTPVDIALPAIPLDLPTLLPPGGTAALVLNLTLEEVTAVIDGMVALTAVSGPLPGGDCDADGTVGAADASAWPLCLGGPAQTLTAGCLCTDLNGDAVVDLRDVALFQAAW